MKMILLSKMNVRYYLFWSSMIGIFDFGMWKVFHHDIHGIAYSWQHPNWWYKTNELVDSINSKNKTLSN
jgi:hypothetical protein